MEIIIKVDNNQKPKISIDKVENEGFSDFDYGLIVQAVTAFNMKRANDLLGSDDGIKKFKEENRNFWNKFKKEVESKGLNCEDIIANNL